MKHNDMRTETVKMAFYGYSVMHSNIYDASFSENSKEWELPKVFDIVSNIIKENKIGDVISVFEEDTEYNGYLLYSLFNDPYEGWVKDYNTTDIELSVLESNGFFDC